MSYDIIFKVKVEGISAYVPVGECDANITWDALEIIVKSTGLPWKNEENNGFCKDVIPYIEAGLRELELNWEEYEQYESPNGFGTVSGVKRFFREILDDWKAFERYENPEIVAITTFWIE